MNYLKIFKGIALVTYLKIVCFIGLLVLAIVEPKNIFDFIMSDMAVSIFSGSVLNFIMKMISYILHDKILLLVMGILAIFLFFIKEYKKSIFILTTAFFGAVITLIIKNTVQRPRPLPELFDGYSFPSGHSVVVALFFLSLLFIVNKQEVLRRISIMCLIIVPISRVTLGAHYVTDVIAGLLLGSIVVDLSKVYYIHIYNIISGVTGIEEK